MSVRIRVPYQDVKRAPGNYEPGEAFRAAVKKAQEEIEFRRSLAIRILLLRHVPADLLHRAELDPHDGVKLVQFLESKGLMVGECSAIWAGRWYFAMMRDGKEIDREAVYELG